MLGIPTPLPTFVHSRVDNLGLPVKPTTCLFNKSWFFQKQVGEGRFSARGSVYAVVYHCMYRFSLMPLGGKMKKKKKSLPENPSHSGPLCPCGRSLSAQVALPSQPFPARLWVFTTSSASGELTHRPETLGIRPSYPFCATAKPIIFFAVQASRCRSIPEFTGKRAALGSRGRAAHLQRADPERIYQLLEVSPHLGWGLVDSESKKKVIFSVLTVYPKSSGLELGRQRPSLNGE